MSINDNLKINAKDLKAMVIEMFEGEATSTEKIKIRIEKAKNENKMEQDLSWEECYDRFLNVTIFYPSHELNAWDYFISIYNDIPQEHRLKLLLLGIYTSYHFRDLEFYKYLKLILDDETVKQKRERMEENKKALEKYLDERDCIKLYRGVSENSLDEEYSISYTVDKSIANWFATRFESGFAEVIEKEYHLSNILIYTDIREEKEVIVIPDILYN